MNDPRPTFREAIAQAGEVVSATSDDDLGRPTPCDEFDVRALLGHMDTVLRRVSHVLDGGAALDVPHVTEGFADGDRVASWKSDAAALEERLDDDSVLDRILTLPFGTVPGRVAFGAYVSELTTHAWDLASAIGRRDLLDDDLATGSLATMQKALPAEPRGGPVPFGPVKAVASDAGAYEKLAGWLGRNPVWTAAAE
ncbi:MAG: TIGR03086 family metal-binding protein [Actinomycetia bacterium]|nr:TIGR03086 family metal-binding protein [Actinomycetes bacterium]